MDVGLLNRFTDEVIEQVNNGELCCKCFRPLQNVHGFALVCVDCGGNAELFELEIDGGLENGD